MWPRTRSTRTNLKIGKPATTLTMCGSPAGIMDQETIYLSNLQGAASDAISGETLTISDIRKTPPHLPESSTSRSPHADREHNLES